MTAPTRAVLRSRDALAYAAFVVAAGALLAVAASLQPSPSGIGTHEALGLPPCPVHALSGLPCPTCGMTTAFAHVARGQIVEGLRAQPLGALLALALALGALAAPALALARVRPETLLDRLRGATPPLVAGAALVASWVYKIAAGPWE